jgi:hypothetical protein
VIDAVEADVTPSAALVGQARVRAPRAPSPRTAALLIACPLTLAYLILAPPAGDLAAATYRSDLFARVGFSAWDTGWYAAHGYWLPSYSLLSPALGALLGVRVLLACSALAAAVLFSAIATRAFPPAAARVAAAVFALGISVGMLSGRVPFDLGFAIGLSAVLALLADRGSRRVPRTGYRAPIGGRLWPALVLAALASIASPVAGAFLALAGLAWATVARRDGVLLCAAALLPAFALSLAYPNGGYEPFAASAFYPALGATTLIALLLPRGPFTPAAHRALRVGAGLYALALVGAYAIHTPVGGNAARLGPLLATPLLAGVLWEPATPEPLAAHATWVARATGTLARRPRALLAALALPLLYWQLATPIHDAAAIWGEPSTRTSYYTPVLGELRRLTGGAATIVEVPMLASHWEAAEMAGHDGVRLARGWERQLDTRYAAIFYGKTLSASEYRAWLAENRVAYVALADGRLDGAGRLEGALIAHGLPYLRELWHSQHWRLYRFMG